MQILFKRVVIVFLLSLSYCFFVFSAKNMNHNKKRNEFVVVKKKKKGISLGKLKERVCGIFGVCMQAGAQVIKSVAGVQMDVLEKTAAYLKGDDPFARLSKAQVQELADRSEQLQKNIDQLSTQCDDFLRYTHRLFSKKTAH